MNSADQKDYGVIGMQVHPGYEQDGNEVNGAWNLDFIKDDVALITLDR